MGIMNREGALYMATGVDNSGLYSGLNQAEGRIDQFGNHISAMGDKITKLTGIGFGIAGLKAFGSEIINVTGEIQMLESSFEVLLGGKGVTGFMAEMKQFAVDSPLSMNGVANAAQTLLGFGIAADKVMPTIKQIGDISMGNEERFKSLNLAFAQMSATGKLMGQDLLQMINAGFNPLQTISEKTGKSIGELKKEMESGAISSEMVADAFASATAEGGKFYGMTQKQAEGIRGLQAQLEGGVQDAFNGMGKSAEGAISIGYKGAISLVENYETVGTVLLGLISTYGAYKTALMLTTSVEKARSSIIDKQLTSDNLAKVSKLDLVKGSAAYTAALEAELIAQNQKDLATLRSTGYEARKNYVQLQGQQIASQQAIIDAKAAGVSMQKITALQAEASATARKVATARAEMITATQNIATKQAEIAANTANVTSTNFLTIAKERLAIAATKVNASLYSNAYLITLTAAVALAYGIYKVSTSLTDLEKSQKRVTDATTKYEAAVASEIADLDILFGRLKNTTKGTNEYEKAKDDIMSKAESYQAGLSKEIDLLNDVAGAYKAISAAAIQSAKDRAMADSKGEALKAYTQSWENNFSKVRKQFISKYGKAQGTLLLDSLKDSLNNDKELSKEVKDAVASFSKNVYSAYGTAGQSQTYESNWVSVAIGQIQIDKKNMQAEIEDLQGVFGEGTGKSIEKPTIFKTYSEQIDDARKKVSDLKTEFNNLQKGIKPKNLKQGEQFDFAQGIENKAKELKEAEDKLSFLLTGQSSSANLKAGNQAESAAEKAIKQAQGIADQQEKIADIKLKQTLESKRKQEDLENQLTQSYINNLAEGSEKIRYQRELDNYLEIQSLERAKEDYIQAYIQAEREKFDAAEDLKLKQNSKYLKKKFDSSSITVDTSSYDTIINNTRNNQAFVQMEAEKKAWNEHLIQFGTYQEKRKAIIEKYEKEIDQALTKGDAATLEKQKQNQLDELDNSVRNSTTLMGQLFADASRKSVNEMQAIIEKADLLLQYLEAVKDEQGNATIGGKNVSKNDILGLGITENTLNNLSQSTQEVESLRNAIKQLKGELGGKSAFKLFEIQIKDAINLINGGKLSQGISGIGSAVSQFSPAVSQFGQDLGNILGNDDLGNKISGIADAIGGLGQTAQGVGQIMSGDIIGGTMAVVSGISKVVDALDGLFGADYSKFNAMKEQYDSLNEVWDQLIDKKKEYLAMAYGEEAKRVGKEAEDLVNKSIESYRLLGKEYLNSGTSAGSHSKGVRQRERINSEGWAELRQWVKNNDISESLYGSVAGGRMTGLFDLTAAQLEKLKEDAPTFWAKLSDETKEYLDNIIDGAAKIEDINKSIKEQLTQVSFDSVFDDFIDTLMDMDSSSKDFADNFANYLQKAILSSLVADKYREKLQSWYDNFAKANEEDGIDAKEYADLQAEYNKIVEDALKERDALKDLLDWTGSDSSSSQSPSKGGYETMSQDTATALEGRFTAIQMSMINVEGYILTLLNINTDSNNTLKAFASNFQEIRNIVLDMMYNIQDINKNTKELYAMNEKLGRIENSLSQL